MYATRQKKIHETIQLLYYNKEKIPMVLCFQFYRPLIVLIHQSKSTKSQFNENGHNGYFVSKKNLH